MQGAIPKGEKAMAPHSSTLAWKIPWTEEPRRLQSMGSQRVGRDWATSLSLFTFMHWRRKWQPTPVFLPGESQGRGSLVGCHLWGCIELNMTEQLKKKYQRGRKITGTRKKERLLLALRWGKLHGKGDTGMRCWNTSKCCTCKEKGGYIGGTILNRTR